MIDAVVRFWRLNMYILWTRLVLFVYTPIGGRVQWFELHDLSVFPSSFRNVVTDALAVAWNAHVPFIFPTSGASFVAERLAHFLSGSGGEHPNNHNDDDDDDDTAVRVLDMCSGGGGPVVSMARHPALASRVRFYLSDLYPNLPVFKAVTQLSQGRVHSLVTPVDATNVPASIGEYAARTMHASFHHMPPALSQRILQHAVATRTRMHIVEFTHRSPLALVLYGASLYPLGCIIALYLAITYAIAGDWRRLLWTPFMPCVLLVDGLISCARTYSRHEFLQVAAKADKTGSFRWRVTTHWLYHVLPIVIYTGVPRDDGDDEDGDGDNN